MSARGRSSASQSKKLNAEEPGPRVNIHLKSKQKVRQEIASCINEVSKQVKKDLEDLNKGHDHVFATIVKPYTYMRMH